MRFIGKLTQINKCYSLLKIRLNSLDISEKDIYNICRLGIFLVFFTAVWLLTCKTQDVIRNEYYKILLTFYCDF